MERLTMGLDKKLCSQEYSSKESFTVVDLDFFTRKARENRIQHFMSPFVVVFGSFFKHTTSLTVSMSSTKPRWL
jgi:hypothetical protein